MEPADDRTNSARRGIHMSIAWRSSTSARPALPIRSASSGWDERNSIAVRRAVGSPGGTKSPCSPSRMLPARPRVWVTITALPIAMASASAVTPALYSASCIGITTKRDRL